MARKSDRTMSMQQVLDRYDGFEKKTREGDALPEGFKTMTLEEKVSVFYDGTSHYETVTNIQCSRERIYVSVKRYTLERYGRRVFRRMRDDGYLIIRKDRTVVSSRCSLQECAAALFAALHERYGDLAWAAKACQGNAIATRAGLDLRGAINRQILKAVLRGAVYSQESLVRAVMKAYRAPDTVGWRDFEAVLALYGSQRVFDLLDFTVCPPQSFRLFAREGAPSAFWDALIQAARLGRKMNASWSEKRLAEEHRRMSEVLMRKEIEAKSREKVQPASVDDPSLGIRHLNTELEVFEEGATMQHCVYTNYWREIKERRYLVFDLDRRSDGEDQSGCTFGIRLEVGLSMFDALSVKPFEAQIFQKRNSPATEGQKNRARVFLETHRGELVAMFPNKAAS